MMGLRRKYFGAANSFRGFICYFDTIFDSSKFDRVYVIKGGPGTGKSSLMKKITQELCETQCDIDEIYCSSDPKSLDGVIISANQRRIAIIDGTSPHQRDAVYPMVTDRIINLADNLDEEMLKHDRDRIIELSKIKGECYLKAYSYLKLSGSADEYIINEYKSAPTENMVKYEAELILSQLGNLEPGSKNSLITSSFGKDGQYTLSDNVYTERTIKVGGDIYSSRLFIDEMKCILQGFGAGFTEHIFPLNTYYAESILLKNNRLIYYSTDNSEIDSRSLFKNYDNILSSTLVADKVRHKALSEAQRWFAEASKHHFALEEIYGRTMIFEKNDIITQNLIFECKNILEL